MNADQDDEFSELVDGSFPRVDLVSASANGIPRFLIAKSAAGPQGVLEAGVVRELVAKAAKPTQAVFTASGKLLGAVDPKDVMRLATGDEPAESAPMVDMDGKTIPIPTDLTPAPEGTVVRKAGTLRNAAEVKIANEAVAAGVAAERAVRAGTLTPAGAALARQHANARAGEQIKRLRASVRR